MVWSRSRLRIVLSTLVIAGCSVAIGYTTVPASATATGSFWIQTMDSCKQALGGADYELSGGGVTMTASAPAGRPHPVAPASGCPLQQGDCASITTGCAQFSNVPPGVYKIIQRTTPPANITNPEGYAPCEGGSACQSEVADVTVAPSGSVTGTVTAVYPDGTVKTWPDNGGPYSGATDDPLVIHDFGLGAGSCDGDADADDHLTGSPSSHCGFPEAQEGTVSCHPYPWSCQLSGYVPGQSGSQHGASNGSNRTTTGGRSTAGVAPRTSSSRTTTRRRTTTTIA
ncbi:MAG: hypothetical protein QOE72_2081 [Chloroflexota bacterium]|jgi:hypothetical protein|nr:hypothetical protein [Chloroflexota bacterium]